MNYNRDSVLELMHYEFINMNIINNNLFGIGEIQEYMQIKSTSYSIFDIYKLLLILILKSNKDFSSYINNINDDNLRKVLIDIITGKPKFLNKRNGHIELSDKNINNTLLGGNSINLGKILKAFISTKILNHSLELYSFNRESIDERKYELEADIGKTIHELAKIFGEIKNQDGY